jgi:hypothetical protein
MFPVLLLYLIIIGIVWIAGQLLHANWLLVLLYRYRLILLGIGIFLSVFAAGEINNLRQQ